MSESLAPPSIAPYQNPLHYNNNTVISSVNGVFRVCRNSFAVALIPESELPVRNYFVDWSDRHFEPQFTCNLPRFDKGLIDRAYINLISSPLPYLHYFYNINNNYYTGGNIFYEPIVALFVKKGFDFSRLIPEFCFVIKFSDAFRTDDFGDTYLDSSQHEISFFVKGYEFKLAWESFVDSIFKLNDIVRLDGFSISSTIGTLEEEEEKDDFHDFVGKEYFVNFIDVTGDVGIVGYRNLLSPNCFTLINRNT